jgi:hypothetical protein
LPGCLPGGILFEIATDPPGFTVDELPIPLGMDLSMAPGEHVLRRDIANSTVQTVCEKAFPLLERISENGSGAFEERQGQNGRLRRFRKFRERAGYSQRG